MAKAGYVAMTGGNVSISTSAKSALGIKAHANFGLDLKKVRISFDGTSSTVAPVIVELCYCTFGGNSPGTNSTSVTPQQVYGRSITVGATAGKNWTSEPTTVTPLEEWELTPNGGTVIYDFPLGDTPDCAVSEGFVLRLTAAATVNFRGAMWFERC